MASLDALLGGSGLACCLLLTLLAWRDGAALTHGRVLGALGVSVSAQLLALSPVAGQLPWLVVAGLRLLGVPNVGLLWWFCLVLLRDDLRAGAAELAGMVGLSLVPLAYALSDAGVTVPRLDVIAAVGSLPPLLMVGHVVTVAVGERGADLLEPRRRARSWLAFALLFALVVALATEELSDVQLASILRNALVVVPMSVTLLLWLTRLEVERLRFVPLAVRAPASASAMDPHDIALHRRLVRALEVDACYLDAGLTIDGLADQLRAPVAQVRTLVNTGLGHRNFPAFLNEHRVAHARRLLADPERARDTVLSVALQSGFASLATFNRVFRDVEGSTPTAFRAAALARQLPENAALPRES